MTEFTERIQKAIVDGKLLESGDRVLVAVSGGLDSMVLLHLLRRWAPVYGWSLTVAHFNHQLRGRSSDADERFVRAKARKWRFACESGSGDVRQFAMDHGLSIEMAARQLRHEFLARTARLLGLQKVALGHHADDQLELFFLRLLRGSGVEGLTGMKPISASPVDARIRLVRPLLGSTRRELEAIAEEEKIAYREDASNQSLDCDRNRIRHELLPLLRNRFQPALHKTVLRLADILAAESEFIGAKTRELQQDESVRFERLHLAVQRRWLWSECLRLGVPADFELIENLRREPDREWMVEPALIVWRDRTGGVQTRRSSLSEFQFRETTVELMGARGQASFGGMEFQWQKSAWSGPVPRRARAGNKGAPCERFDADRIGDRIRLRHWRPGDRFQPIGMAVPVKVQDLLTNKKVPRWRRVELVLAETLAGEIFWIEGLRMAERFKIDGTTRHALEWRWRPAG